MFFQNKLPDTIKNTLFCLVLHFKNTFEKIEIFLFFSLLQINIILVFLDHFDVLVSKIIFKK